MPRTGSVGAAGYTGLLLGPVAVGAFTTVGTLRSGLGTVIVVFGIILAVVAAALPPPATTLSAGLNSRRNSGDPVL